MRGGMEFDSVRAENEGSISRTSETVSVGL